MTERNDTIPHRWFEEVWNNGREEAIDEMFAEEAIAHGLSDGTGNTPRGPAGFKPFYNSFRSSFPDIHITVEDTICEGDKIVARCHIQATHTGDGLGIPATGKPVDFKGVAIVRIADGKIVEAWNHFDFIDMYQQIGAFQLVNETVIPRS
jgi:steroid delta-isomerase-like uncharacterized protein